MCNLYNLLTRLCEERGITGYRMCKDTGISPGAMTDLKMGRRETLSAENMNKIANYFGVSVGFLLGDEQQSDIEELYSENRVLLHRIGKLKPEDKQYVKDLIARLEGGNGD